LMTDEAAREPQSEAPHPQRADFNALIKTGHLDEATPDIMPRPHTPEKKAVTQLAGTKMTTTIVGLGNRKEPPEVEKAVDDDKVYSSFDWQRMHTWDIKMTQSAKDTADIEGAHVQCDIVNMEKQKACGKIYCKFGEAKGCGGICNPEDTLLGDLQLTPLNVDAKSDHAWFQTSERQNKEIAEKKETADRATWDQTFKDSVAEGKAKTKAHLKNVTIIEDEIEAEKEEKKQVKAAHKEVVAKAEANATKYVADHLAASSSEAAVKAAQKASQLDLELEGCKAKANQTKYTCIAVEKTEKQAAAAGSAKLVKEEENAVEEAAEEGFDALEKEQATKKEAYDNAKNELAAKAEAALPSNLPKGKFDWALDKPCDAGAGTFSQLIEHDTKIVVGTVPIGKRGLRVDLRCDEDVDIELWDGKSGEAIIAWMEGKIDSSSESCDQWAGNKICYSGYFGVDFNAGQEWITVDEGTSHPYIIKAYGFSSGWANVTYKWDGMGPDCVNPVLPPLVFPKEAEIKEAEEKDDKDGNATNAENATAVDSPVAVVNAPFQPAVVKCQLSVDNTLASVTYNGEDVSWTGFADNWKSDKEIAFTTAKGGVLEVTGKDSEGTNMGHCKSAGFQIQCDSEDDEFWDKFDSGSENIAAAGGMEASGGAFGIFSAPCESASAFYLPANPKLKKLWAPNGQRWAKFRMGPSVVVPAQVKCQLSIDNTLSKITYNGNAVAWTGSAGNWKANKEITFSAVEGGVLEITGKDSEGGNSGHCISAGFVIQCDSDRDEFWDAFDSSSNHVVAAGGEDVEGSSYSAFDAPCSSTSGFYLPANNLLKKLWAPEGQRWAKFAMGPTVVAPATVTCQMTMDNTLTGVTYNGNPITWSGDAGNWKSNKKVTFSTVDGGVLEVTGKDSEAGNSGHCKSAGFSIQCDSKEDKFWDAFDSGSEHIVAAGGADGGGDLFSEFDAPCGSTSGFYLPANNQLKKLWAPEGQRWAKFKMGPIVTVGSDTNVEDGVLTMAPTPVPAPTALMPHPLDSGTVAPLVELLMVDSGMPEACELESNETMGECAIMSSKEVTQKFGNMTADFQAAKSAVLEKESEEKKAVTKKLDDVESAFKANSTAIGSQLDDELDDASIKYNQEKVAKKKELGEKKSAETKRRHEEKAYKDGAPERDSKERAKKARPQCREATSHAISGCRKVTDEGYRSCAAIFASVPMANAILRPFAVINDKPDYEHVEQFHGINEDGGQKGSAAGSGNPVASSYLASMAIKQQQKVKSTSGDLAGAVSVKEVKRLENYLQPSDKPDLQQLHAKKQLNDLFKFSNSMEDSDQDQDKDGVYDDDDVEAAAYDREHDDDLD